MVVLSVGDSPGALLPPATPAARADVPASAEPVCCMLGKFAYLRLISPLNLLYIFIKWNL